MKDHDVASFVEWVTEVYQPSVRVDRRAGHYTRQPGEPAIDLYGVADMACVLYTVDRLELDSRARSEWSDAFDTFQDEDGYYVEATPTHDRIHSTAFSVAAMELLDLEPRRPLRFAEAFADPAAIEPFLTGLDWTNDVYMASHRGAGLASLIGLIPELASPEWFDVYFDALDRRFDPVNGMLGDDKPPSGDVDQIGSTFHYHFLYEWWDRPMPYPEARIDAVLGLQQANGRWADASPLWVTLDAVYLLTRTVARCGHRLGDVEHAVHRAIDSLEAHVLAPSRRDEHFDWYLGAHSLTAAVSILAEAQRFLGPTSIEAGRTLRLVLDRRPFI